MFYPTPEIEPSLCFVVFMHGGGVGYFILLHGPGFSQQYGYGA